MIKRRTFLFLCKSFLEFICFKQEGAIPNLSDKRPDVDDQFTYLRSNISSTKSDVSLRIGKAWTVIDRLSNIWKSDHSDKIK